MVSIGRALTWEFYRENRWWWLCVGSAIAGIGLLVFKHDDKLSIPKEIHVIAFFVVFFFEILFLTMFQMMTQYNSENQRLGFPTHLYTKPVPTYYLIVWRLSLILLATALFHGLVTLTFKLSANIVMPWLVPTLLLCLTMAWVQALTWLFPSIQWLQTIGGGLALFPYLGLLAFWADEITAEERQAVSLVRLLQEVPLPALLIGLAGAYLVAWIGVTLDRRQVSLNPAHLLTRFQSTTTGTTHSLPSTSSPFWTLFRFEMQHKGWQWPLANAAGFLVLLTLWLTHIMPMKIFAPFIMLGGAINIFVIPILIGFVIGQHGKGHLQIESYKAVKPVTNQEFLRVYLLTGLASLLLAWVVYITGPALLAGILLLSRETETLSQLLKPFDGMHILSKQVIIPNALSYLLMIWAMLSLSATVMLAGRRWLAITLWIGIWFAPAFLGMIVEMSPNDTLQDMVQNTIFMSVAIVFMGGTLLAFFQAYQQKWLSPKTLIACIIAYLLIAFILLPLNYPTGLPNHFLSAFLAGVLALPLLPIAAAPLALAWNRHR